MVTPLSPQRTKAIGPRIRIHAIKAKLRHTGRMKSLTLNHSLNQDHVCANRFAHIRQSLCPLSRARDALPRRLMNGRGIGGSGEEHYEYPLFLAPRSPLRCEQPSSYWCSALGVSFPNIFVTQILTRECTAPAMFLRRSNVIFMKILCAVPKLPWSFPRNRRMHQRFRCQLRNST